MGEINKLRQLLIMLNDLLESGILSRPSAKSEGIVDHRLVTLLIVKSVRRY
jgi:hypothetical protein